jgi:hypothetical protein
MRFVIATAVMNESDEILDQLDQLLTRVEDEVHELEIVEADLLEDSRWFASARQTRKEILKNIAQTTIYRARRTSGPHLRTVQVSDSQTVRLARHLAYTPLHVIVENFSSDGALLKWALTMLAASEVYQLCFGHGARATPPALQIESPGGHGDIPKLLDKRLYEAASRGIPPRVVIITDSDVEWPGDVKPHVHQIREKCAVIGVPCPPMTKRTAENYIPDVVWTAWAADHPRYATAITALLRLSPAQRVCVNIAPSNTAPWEASKPQAQALFADVSVTDEAELKAASLKGGKTRAISHILEKYASACSTTDLVTRDYGLDLQVIVHHITDEL